ncbi:MAG: HAMP domain-containing protein [Gammaproteobacteria bacterium]|nr:HAMP domain-containing protein [Gammaproteobacteria bacterium]MYI76616.1 HAMP domain-containing protein [Gammaproteobacteria bacterium]
MTSQPTPDVTPRRWTRISFRLGALLLGAVFLTLVATFVSNFYFQSIQRFQKVVNEEAVPNMESAFNVSLEGGQIVNAVPSLTAVSDIEALETLKSQIDVEQETFRNHLREVGRIGLSEESQDELNSNAEALLANIDTVENLVEERFTFDEKLAELSNEFGNIEEKIRQDLATEIDEQTLFFSMGYSELGQAPVARSEHFNQAEFNRYRYLIELRRNANISGQLLSQALNVNDTPNLETLKDQFESSEFSIHRALKYLEDDKIYEKVEPIFGTLLDVGLSEEGIFPVKSRLIQIEVQIENLFTSNRELGESVVSTIEEVVTKAKTDADTATTSSANVVTQGQVILVVLVVITAVGAVLIAVTYINPKILKRLDLLSRHMRVMAKGDFEEKIEVDGKDEIADMQEALEVFRRNSLEAQRLNLVETLAEELSKKNEDLESANVELKHAQGQIVMREKLAALGELTAGVAHEIRNPMNFIKNFSESSEDLLEEMIEEISEPDKRDPPGSEMDMGLIEEISEDLVSNLKRIRQHTTRANRIIDDMLKMGRDTQEFQPTDLNELLDEHARLAFHSARAQDIEFQLDIQYDLDNTVGDVKVVPQDMGRLFINLVANSGYACNEKLKTLLAEDPNSDYVPTLSIKTQRMGDQIILTFKDNGTGIPQDAIEKIFNPFFTTKPTDQGTGLGLSLCNDIVRTHGGEMRVFSEDGEYTEMVIDLPEDPAMFMEV